MQSVPTSCILLTKHPLPSSGWITVQLRGPSRSSRLDGDLEVSLGEQSPTTEAFFSIASSVGWIRSPRARWGSSVFLSGLGVLSGGWRKWATRRRPDSLGGPSWIRPEIPKRAEFAPGKAFQNWTPIEDLRFLFSLPGGAWWTPTLGRIR